MPPPGVTLCLSSVRHRQRALPAESRTSPYFLQCVPPMPPIAIPQTPLPSSSAQPVAVGLLRTGEAIWAEVLTALRATTSRAVVDSWLDKVQVGAVHADRVELRVDDDQLREFVATHYGDVVQAALVSVLGRPVTVDMVTAAPAWLGDEIRETRPLPRQPQLSLDDLSDGLDGSELQDLAPRFTFDSFVTGPANELAAAAALAVAEAPGLAYNPLFIHGGVGLGKTHLLHAIGQHARGRNARLRVRYVAAETFIDDTLSAWRSRDGGARAEVRALYRHNVDLLLVDDVQFLQGKNHIQEEFFHIFNALHQAGKQIVLTCDRFPSELQQFHDRLRSRFEWGLVAEVTPPDRDLRVALVHRKARDMGMPLPVDVGLYLADHLRNNVRELEGALTKLSAHARIGKRTVDLTLARSVLGPVIELPSRNLTAEVIQRVTAQQFSLKITDLKGQKRHRSVVVPRMIAIYLTRKHTSMSYPDIGRAFGGRDHSTAIHACQKVEWMLATHADVQASVQAIETALGK